jgi:hypothetical protein
VRWQRALKRGCPRRGARFRIGGPTPPARVDRVVNVRADGDPRLVRTAQTPCGTGLPGIRGALCNGINTVYIVTYWMLCPFSVRMMSTEWLVLAYPASTRPKTENTSAETWSTRFDVPEQGPGSPRVGLPQAGGHADPVVATQLA